MKTFLLIGIMVLSVVGLLNAQSVPPVVINEVVYDPLGSDNSEDDETTYEWIELKNVSVTPQDISGWEIRASTYYPLSALIAPVPVGGFVIIHEGIGDDTNVDFGRGTIAYLYMDKTGSQLGNSSGDLALYNSTSNTKDTIVDYFAYGAPSSSTNHTHAVDAGIWTSGDFVDISSDSEGYSIEYDGEGDLSSDYFIQQNPTKGDGKAINGKVLDAVTGNPIPEAIVIAINSETGEKAKVVTDDGGYYKISNLKPGTYLVLCIKQGYKPGIKKAEVVANDETSVPFKLVPK
jgi:hypothetical protein